MVSTGFSEVIGSWKTMPMSPPRTCAHFRIGQLHEVAPGKADFTPGDASWRVGDKAQDGKRA